MLLRRLGVAMLMLVDVAFEMGAGLGIPVGLLAIGLSGSGLCLPRSSAG